MACLSRRMFTVARPLIVARSLSCSRMRQYWWSPQPVKSLTDVPVRMKGKAKKSQVPKIDEDLLEGHVNVEALKKAMQQAVDALEWQYTKAITLRPTAALLDHVKLNIGGKAKRIRDVAQVSQQKDGFIVTCLSQPELIATIQDAVAKSGLELDCVPGSKGVLRIPVPKVTKDLRTRLAKLAKEAADKTKVGLRRVRSNGMDEVKKLEGRSADDLKSFEVQIDLLGKLYVSRVDAILKAKNTELAS